MWTNAHYMCAYNYVNDPSKTPQPSLCLGAVRPQFVAPDTSRKIAAYEPIISKNVSCLLSWLAKAQSSCKDVAFVNAAPYVHRFTFDTIVEIIFGETICLNYPPTLRQLMMPSQASKTCRNLYGVHRTFPGSGWLMSTRPMVSLTRRPTYDAGGNMTSVGALTARTLGPYTYSSRESPETEPTEHSEKLPLSSRQRYQAHGPVPNMA